MIDRPKSRRLIVRNATLADAAAFRALYEEFHLFHVEALPEHLRAPREGEVDQREFVAKFQAIVADDDAAMFAAEVESRLVGFAEAYIRELSGSPWRHGRRYGFLQSLGVTGRHRGHGVGRELVAAVERWAQSRGASEMRVEAWEFDNGPLPFYEALGYATLERTLVRRLAG